MFCVYCNLSHMIGSCYHSDESVPDIFLVWRLGLYRHKNGRKIKCIRSAVLSIENCSVRIAGYCKEIVKMCKPFSQTLIQILFIGIFIELCKTNTSYMKWGFLIISTLGTRAPMNTGKGPSEFLNIYIYIYIVVNFVKYLSCSWNIFILYTSVFFYRTGIFSTYQTLHSKSWLNILSCCCNAFTAQLSLLYICLV